MGRKWKMMYMALAVLLTLGLALLTGRRMHEKKQELALQTAELESVVAFLGQEELEHQRNLAKWYNYNLKLGTNGLERAYETILNFGQGRMAVLAVPEWELRLPVYHGGGGEVNHDPATSFPLGGREDHTVLMLSDPYPWRPGLTLYIDCLGQRFLYRVESVQVMGAGWPTERPGSGGQDLLTLVYDRGNTRTLIRCVRCGELVMREEKGSILYRTVLPTCLMILIFPMICRMKRCSACVQRS